MASCCARSEHCGLGVLQLHLLGSGKHKLYLSMYLEAIMSQQPVQWTTAKHDA